MNASNSSDGSTIDQPWLGPVAGRERHNSMDVIRGVALFGILLMNIIGFGYGQGPSEFIPEETRGGASYWSWFIMNTFFEGTQRTLFSILFGAGVIILTSRGEERGGGLSVADVYYRRNIWLIIFGMINSYLLLWDGDILYYYGIAALFLFPIRNMKPAHLLMVAFAGLLLLAAQYRYDLGEEQEAYVKYQQAMEISATDKTLDKEQKEDIDAWEETQLDWIPDVDELNKRIEGHTTSYAGTFKRHVPGLTNDHGNGTYRFGFLDAFSIMALGMALFKLGVLTLKQPPRVYWLMMLVGYGIGFPLSVWETNHIIQGNFSYMSVMEVTSTYDVGRVANGIGHLGLLLLWVRSGWLKGLQDKLAAVGRMALTNYIMHSVIALFVFLSVGLGLYGQLERYELYYVVIAICLFQLIVSPIWLRHYRFGPLEWVWRSLTYMHKQKMRRET